MTATLIETPLLARWAEQQVRVFLDYTPLPYSQIVARPEAVHVVVATVADLTAWQAELGGEIRQGQPVAGVAAWVLFTETPPTKGRTAQVRVSTLVVDGESAPQTSQSGVAA